MDDYDNDFDDGAGGAGGQNQVRLNTVDEDMEDVEYNTATHGGNKKTASSGAAAAAVGANDDDDNYDNDGDDYEENNGDDYEF